MSSSVKENIQFPVPLNTSKESLSLRSVTRLGAYGIAIQSNFNQDSVLLVAKETGCYGGLWDLPGGGIEFGETVEEALTREFLEEVAMSFEYAQLVCNVVHNREVLDVSSPFRFHHIGLVYRVFNCLPIENAEAEDRWAWFPLNELDLTTLTPIAKESIEKILASY